MSRAAIRRNLKTCRPSSAPHGRVAESTSATQLTGPQPRTGNRNPEDTAMPEHDTSTAGDQHAAAARAEARRAIFQLAREGGAHTVTRPLYHGAETTTVDVEPLPGARAARHLEFAAHAAARDFIRQARETGHGWDRIGHALGVTPNDDAGHAGMATAEAAYTYAAGSPSTDTAIRYGRSVTWRCPSCDQLIDDRGLIAGPLDNERGHARPCPRLGAALAEWDADWEAEP